MSGGDIIKELLSLILAFFTSLGTSTEFSIVQDKPYTTNYYTVDVTDPPDYREFFSSGASASNETNCKTTVYSAQGKRVDGSVGYWVANNQTYQIGSLGGKVVAHTPTDYVTQENKIDYYKVEECFTEGVYIIMPFSGTLQSPSSNTMNNSITVYCTHPETGVQYKLKFCEMRCWYCDIGRDGALDKSGEHGTMYHTSDEKAGKKFPAGSVLGVATDKTYFQIVPIDQSEASIGTADLVQFYNGEYKKFDD